MRVAQDDLRAHVDEFVDEEEAAFKHLLVEKHAPLGLRGHDKENRKEVGGETRPGRVGQRHERAVDERLNLIMFEPGM